MKLWMVTARLLFSGNILLKESARRQVDYWDPTVRIYSVHSGHHNYLENARLRTLSFPFLVGREVTSWKEGFCSISCKSTRIASKCSTLYSSMLFTLCGVTFPNFVRSCRWSSCSIWCALFVLWYRWIASTFFRAIGAKTVLYLPNAPCLSKARGTSCIQPLTL